MSENNNLEANEVSPAQLSEGEALIPHELVGKYEEAVRELNEKAENLAAEGIKVSRPKEALESDSDNIIGSKGTRKKGGVKTPGLAPVHNGALGSSKVEKINKEKPDYIKPETEKVALHSTKNVYWNDLGEIKRGYNIVRKDRAEKWLTRSHVRLATPEEVAKEFGK
jgi:hypothetical protein